MIAPARNKPSHKVFLGGEQAAFDCPGGRYETGRSGSGRHCLCCPKRGHATPGPRAARGSSNKHR
eukprot:136427-Chlamydomonas_euryale.AAC.1